MRNAWKITGLIGSAAIAISACSSPGSPRTPDAAPAATSSPSSGAPAAPTWAPRTPDALLLTGRATDPGVHIIQASTGETMLDLPAGAPATAEWQRMIVAAPHAATTTVSDVFVQPGLDGPDVVIDGAWRLPTIGYEPTPVGLSADGSTAVLVEATSAPEGPSAVSRFAVLKIDPLEGAPQILELSGSFEYDAISFDGHVLYVVEHLTGEGSAYQVRAIDLPAGTMRDGIIADKRNLGEAMAGWPIAQLRSPDGMVFTLYRGLEHPFIHALNTTDGWAICIDLPAAHTDDLEAALHWGLTASSDWSTVFAANAALGIVSEVDTAELSIRRSVTDASVGVTDRAVALGPSIDLAKFGHEAGGPVGRRIVIAPDGKTAYAAGPDGIVALNTSDLAVTARLLNGASVDGLGITPDGSALFALLHDGGRIVELDPANGHVFGTVPGDGFNRLLAVVPW